MIVNHCKKSIVVLLMFIFIVSILPLNCFAASDSGINTAKIDEYVTSQMKQTNIPGLSIGIIKGDKILYLKGYGNADKERNVTAQTPFEIGSVTKSFTALAILQLVEKGLIDLNSPIDKYLPWFKAYYQNEPAVITVKQLLNQDSGVPTFFDNDVKADASIEKVVKEKLNNRKLVNPPGAKFLYSNANFIILGEIIQVISGQSYKEYIEKNIFIPLEMKHSYTSKEEAVSNGFAAGYRSWFGFPIKADLPYFEGNLPCGHIISCSEDMAHYLSALINGGKYKDVAILSTDGIKTLMTPCVKTLVPMGVDATEVKYAMGWAVNYKNDKIDVIEHTGETSNYHAHAVINPEEKVAVIEMDNLGGYITAGQIAPGVLKIALNEQPSASINLRNIILISNLIYVIVASLLLISILRLRKFRKRINKSKSRFVFNIIFTLLINLIMPVGLVLGAPVMSGATWKATIIFSPDISFVFIAASIILFIIGIFKLVIIIFSVKSKRQYSKCILKSK